ncbi:hypothetical protein TD95_002689 [Thielaviopsis punctulata]|uniref:J domain-containing protein n=1 Tax=Thielaviopsis punctulata TaxID=72032 RepID=A0A0F4ZHQ5_9PEZI|nr:hypothetical protein TD95_002689 [Thielaviopsis punctulata]
MKFSSVCIGLLALLSPVTAAWSKEDREIFRVRAEIQSAEGSDVTFYSYMGIPSSASPEDIKKGYRKMTRQLHPDKVRQRLFAEKAAAAKKDGKAKTKPPPPPSRAEINKAIKIASEKQARLTIVNDILRGPGRDRYDHYLANGFPLWKGTDYYYSRYRPGLGTVLTGFFIVVGGGFHYLALYMSWKRQREFVERYVKFARDTAWGDLASYATAPAPVAAPETEEVEDEQAPPVPRNRRERRMMEKHERTEGKKPVPKRKPGRAAAAAAQEQDEEDVVEEVGPVGARRRVVAENGKIMVVDSLGDVYLEEQDVEGNVNMYLLDPEELLPPTVYDTAIFRLPCWAMATVAARLGLSKGPAAAASSASEASDAADSDSAQDIGSDFEIVDKSVDDLGMAKSSGAQTAGGKKRGNKKR